MRPSYSIGVDFGGTNLRVAAYEQGIEFLETISVWPSHSTGSWRCFRQNNSKSTRHTSQKPNLVLVPVCWAPACFHFHSATRADDDSDLEQ